MFNHIHIIEMTFLMLFALQRVYASLIRSHFPDVASIAYEHFICRFFLDDPFTFYIRWIPFLHLAIYQIHKSKQFLMMKLLSSEVRIWGYPIQFIKSIDIHSMAITIECKPTIKIIFLIVVNEPTYKFDFTLFVAGTRKIVN